MDIIQILAQELQIRKSQAEAAVRLIDEGNTIPFIARYRKEMTGGLNDEVLRQLDERLRYLRNLEERKEQVLASIEEQGKLTEELRQKITAAATLVAVEDLYLPYRPKRRTRATIARERGLEPLAEILWAQEADVYKRQPGDPHGGGGALWGADHPGPQLRGDLHGGCGGTAGGCEAGAAE